MNKTMDTEKYSMNTIELLKANKKTRAEINHEYYVNNKFVSHRNSLLFDVRSKGRVPTLHSIKKYNIKIEELVKNWRIFKESTEDIKDLKVLKFQALILNLI